MKVVYLKPKITSFLFDFHISPELEHCGLINNVTHIPSSAAQSEITQFTTMLDHRRRYEERKEKRFRASTAGPSTQYQNERNAARRGSSDTTTSTAETRRSNQRQDFYSGFK
jgi:hypothetical protein